MNKQQAYKKYKEYRYYINQYQDADETVIVNEDPDLRPIEIKLPEPPDWIYIDGFGKPPSEQKWIPPKIPKALVKLQKECNTLEQLYDVLNSQQFRYSEEIKWIKTQWYHRRHGYWLFINGRPTYLSSDHWYYLAWWNLDVGLPTFRDRDRKTWLAEKFLEKTTLTFAYLDKEGFGIKNADGTYDMIDLGYYVLLGILYSKGRSEGATYRACCKHCNIMTLAIESMSGIQSKDDEDAKRIFVTKLVRPFNKLPFFFKPLTVSDTLTQSKLVFNAVSQRMKGGSIANIKVGLESEITFGPSTEGHYDSTRLLFNHDDEIGKGEKFNLEKRHQIKKDCLRKQSTRYGWAWYTSTVGETTKGGGEQFRKLAEQCSFYQRNENGFTIEGLAVLYVSSIEGFDKEIDEFGYSLKESAMKKIMAERDGYVKANNMVGWAEAVRHNPIYYAENFVSNPKDNDINIYIVESRLKQVRMNPLEFITPGYFKWDKGADSTVVFEATPEAHYSKAKFNISLLPVPEKTNRKEYKNGSFCPIGNEFLAGGDAYRFDSGSSRYLSKGGGYVFQLRDKTIDTDDCSPLRWQTYRTVCDYLHRPSTREEYLEDMLMMCIFWNALMYPEAVIVNIQEHFIKRGYRGYLKYDVDSKGKLKPNAGYYSEKENVYNCVRDYTEEHGFREKHPRVLEQQKNIQGIAGLTEQDLFASQGGALMGVKNILDKEAAADSKKKFRPAQSGRDIIKIVRM